jgi:putative flippase GtrA
MLLNLIAKYKKIIKFGIVGFIGALIDFGVLLCLVEIFQWPVLVANTLSFLLAVINGFIWNKYWTFRDTGQKHLRQFLAFLLVSCVGLVLNLLLMKILINLGLFYAVAKVLIIIVVAVWNYLANNFFTFRDQPKLFNS